MDKYKANLIALDKIRKTNRKLNDIDKTLKNKYECNMKHVSMMQEMLLGSIDRYHGIIRNLDRFLS